jgi:uncharacterized protein
MIPSRSGLHIEVWLYKPETRGPWPVLVMGPGIGLVKSGGLPPFCDAFNTEGYAAITIDHLSFGGSQGTPRNVLNVDQELQDYRDVIAWARTQNMFDPEKVVSWGTSFGGMHAAALISEDHRLAASIAQCPVVDGFLASMMLPLSRSVPMMAISIADTVGSWFGMNAIYLTTAGNKNSGLAILKAHDVEEGWARLMPEDGSSFLNQLAARSLLSIITHRPGLRTHRSTKPFLVVSTEYDTVAPLSAARKAAKAAPLGEIVVIPGGHFDLYKGGSGFEKNIAAQLEFLRRVVPV